MRLFRNKEIRSFFVFLLILSAVLITAAFAAGISTGILMLSACVLFYAAFYIFTKRRYSDIAELSEQIDMILHGRDSFEIKTFKEGELSILQSEIQKMTVRLREQADILKKDKIYLADSLADIAHQLRTPMTSLNMLISFLPKNDFTREAEELLSRMDWLLTTLLKISKIDAGTVIFQKEETTLTELIKKSAEPFFIPLELRNIKLKTNCAGNVTCDINWTAEAIGNIIKNCTEHVGDTLRGVPTIEINCIENAIYAEIIICDNGAGIAPEDLPYIFERFYQAENAKNENFGIGLALCKVILSEQNATIKVANREDGGACFTVRFYK